MTIAVARDDLDAVGLRASASGCRDGAAARVCGMDRQSLRDWVHRYNAEGLAGLVNRHGGGPAALLTAAQRAALKEIVLAGPDPEVDGVVRWRCVDLQRVIGERFAVTIADARLPSCFTSSVCRG